jgi:GT2 family glycosyltransferase
MGHHQGAYQIDMSAPDLSIIILHTHRKGYPEACLRSYGLDQPRDGTEILLIDGLPPSAPAPFAHVRRIAAPGQSDAAAKNTAIAQASGEYIALISSDTLGQKLNPTHSDAIGQLQNHARTQATPSIVAAQILLENGYWHWTHFRIPTLWRELALLRRPLRLLRHILSENIIPLPGQARPAESVRANCLVAHRSVFDKAGPFAEGYQFGVEDMEWCIRARAAGIDTLILPAAQAHKIAPQRFRRLTPLHTLAAYHANRRLLRRTRGPLVALTYTAIRTLKAALALPILLLLHTLTLGAHPHLRHELHTAALTLTGRCNTDLIPDDIASDVWWERLF